MHSIVLLLCQCVHITYVAHKLDITVHIMNYTYSSYIMVAGVAPPDFFWPHFIYTVKVLCIFLKFKV